MFFPISPPSASSSRTRCPFEVPPIFGLHGIMAILSTLTVKTIVFRPSLAQARAASQPACPAPTTTMSYASLFSHTDLLNISFTKSSPIVSPVMLPRDSYASIKSIVKKSSGIWFSMLSSTFFRLESASARAVLCRILVI